MNLYNTLLRPFAALAAAYDEEEVMSDLSESCKHLNILHQGSLRRGDVWCMDCRAPVHLSVVVVNLIAEFARLSAELDPVRPKGRSDEHRHPSDLFDPLVVVVAAESGDIGTDDEMGG